MTIYCNPGRDWAACFAQKWNCQPEMIEHLFGEMAGDDEQNFKRICRAMDALERNGYKRAAYCERCGHQEMMYELSERAA